MELDPGSLEAQSQLATALADRANTGMTDSAAADVARAEELIGKALAASPFDQLAHFAKGVALRVRGRPEEAIPEFEMVLAFNRNETRALFHLGWCKLMTGSIDEVIPLAEASHPPQSPRSLYSQSVCTNRLGAPPPISL